MLELWLQFLYIIIEPTSSPSSFSPLFSPLFSLAHSKTNTVAAFMTTKRVEGLLGLRKLQKLQAPQVAVSPLTTAEATSLKSRPVRPASCSGVQVEVAKKAWREPRRSVI